MGVNLARLIPSLSGSPLGSGLVEWSHFQLQGIKQAGI